MVVRTTEGLSIAWDNSLVFHKWVHENVFEIGVG